MSAHDPYDGIYDAPESDDSGAPTAETPTPPADTSAVEPPDPAVEVSVYTRSQLERMRKAELVAVARERGLDASGDRDALIERIEAAQGASA